MHTVSQEQQNTIRGLLGRLTATELVALYALLRADNIQGRLREYVEVELTDRLTMKER